MDDELRELERAQAADPADEAAAERLKAALLRAGRREDVRQRYKLGFVCGQPWDAMLPGPNPDIRHCGSCRRLVYLAATYADFDRLAALGHCVAAYPDRLPQVLDGLVDATGRPFARGEGPCLVERPVAPPLAQPMPMPLAGGPMPVRPPLQPIQPLDLTHPTPPPVQPQQPSAPNGGVVGWLRGLFGG